MQNDAKMNVLSHIGQSCIGKGETMSQDVVERLLGRLITDENFRQMAADSLFVACHQTGFLLTSTEMELLSGLDIDWFAEFSRRIEGVNQRCWLSNLLIISSLNILKVLLTIVGFYYSR